jgi:DNA-binding transcriptional regulator LsrR (DeoR family)
MQEHEFYNLHRGASLREVGEALFRQLVIHLRMEHGMRLRDIARRLGIPQREVSRILSTHRLP